nr:hypothetical protein CFP56_18356 [Quercus suber]
MIAPVLRGDRNLTNLFLPRALLLHGLFLKKDIENYAHIYHLLVKCISKRTSRMTLPFPGLIMSIMRYERVQIPLDLPMMKREDQIYAQTMTRSKACLRGPGEEEERVEGEDTAPKGGNTDEDIDNFTLDPEDMEASPTQPQQ